MEFKVFQKEIELQSKGWRPTFHDVTSDILKIVEESGIKNGTVCIASHHTTCSVITQECAFDMSMTGRETLQQDKNIQLIRKSVENKIKNELTKMLNQNFKEILKKIK